MKIYYKNFMFLQMPITICKTKRLTKMEKEVFSIVLTLLELHPGKYQSISQLASYTSAKDRKHVRLCLKKLVEVKLLSKIRIKINGHTLTNYDVLDPPEWLLSEGHLYLCREKEGGNLYPKSKKEGGNLYPSLQKIDKKEGGNLYPKEGGNLYPKEGGIDSPPIKESFKDSFKRTIAENFRQAKNSEVFDYTEDDIEDDDELEINYDGDSVQVQKKLLKQKESVRVRRAKVKKLKKENSDSSFTKTPSLRWEFQEHKRKVIKRWSGSDLIGYWVTKYLDMMGKESEEFFVSSLDCEKIKKHRRNAALYVKKHYEGNYRSVKERIDCVFDNAVVSGKEIVVSFAYYFTPSNRSTLDSVFNGTYGKQSKEKSLYEINNNKVWDDEEEEKRAVLALKKIEIREARRAAEKKK